MENTIDISTAKKILCDCIDALDGIEIAELFNRNFSGNENWVYNRKTHLIEELEPTNRSV